MSMCNVLAVLGDNEETMWEAFDAAVALADAENARLTLAKTCDDGRAYMWITPFAFGGVYVPPPVDSSAEAARRLAQIAERVPRSTPVTTVVLGNDTQDALLQLLRSGHFGAVVADRDLLRHCRRLRRQCEREEIQAIAVSPRSSVPVAPAAPAPAPAPVASAEKPRVRLRLRAVGRA
jgi:hypothetical protein